MFNKKKGFQKHIDSVLSKGKNINESTYKNQALLHYAISKGWMDIVEFLLSHGADPNKSFKEEDLELTLMHILPAIAINSEETFELLRSRGGKLHAKNSKGETPMHIAAMLGNTTCLTYLIKHLRKVDYLDNENETPLHKAAYWGRNESIEILLKAKADINAISDDGMTPLHLTMYYAPVETTALLLENGADESIKNKEDMTPLNILQTHLLDDKNTQGKFELLSPILKALNDPEIMEKLEIASDISEEDPNELKKAVKIYTEIITKVPLFPHPYIYRGYTYVQLEQYNKAYTDYNKAIEVDPYCGEAYRHRAVYLFMKEKKDEAIKDIERAIELGDEEAQETMYKFQLLDEFEESDNLDDDDFFKK